MSLLVKSIEIFKKHITVNDNFTYEQMLPYLRAVERSQIKPVIGRAMYASLIAADPTEPIPLEVLDLLHEASSNLAMLDASKVLAVQISDAGIFVHSTNTATPADWATKRDMRRYLLQTGQKALDEALEIMEENEGEFPEWTASSGFTHFTEFFVRQTKEFQKYFNINKSRLTFLRLKPHLLKVENKYFQSLLGAETVFQIKHGSLPEEKKALELCQAAQVSLCVSELAREGAFNLSADGFFVSIDEIPGEKKIFLGENERMNLQRVKQNDGIEQLKVLTEYLRNNPTKFSLFEAKEEITITVPVQNTGSIVSF
jgi:hypothetical protein